MIALDTNVLARFLLKDDAVQHRAAAALLAGAQEFTAPPTVLLELVWVLEACDCCSATHPRPEAIIRMADVGG